MVTALMLIALAIPQPNVDVPVWFGYMILAYGIVFDVLIIRWLI